MQHLGLRRLQRGLNLLNRLPRAGLRLQSRAGVACKIGSVRAARLLPQQIRLNVDLRQQALLSYKPQRCLPLQLLTVPARSAGIEQPTGPRPQCVWMASSTFPWL